MLGKTEGFLRFVFFRGSVTARNSRLQLSQSRKVIRIYTTKYIFFGFYVSQWQFSFVIFAIHFMDYPIGTRVKHPSKGEGVIMADTGSSYRIFFNPESILEIGKGFGSLELIELGKPSEAPLSLDTVSEALEQVLLKYTDMGAKVELGNKWIKGTLVFEPADNDIKAHEIPIETFFHKIVMVRDRLRVLEQNINSHKQLNDEEKVDLQQYITRIYGSLTSFNFLFRNKEDYFVGESSKK